MEIFDPSKIQNQKYLPENKISQDHNKHFQLFDVNFKRFAWKNVRNIQINNVIGLWNCTAGGDDPVAADHLAVLINEKMNLVSNCPNLPWQSSYSFYIRSLKKEIVSFFFLRKLRNLHWFSLMWNGNSLVLGFNLYFSKLRTLFDRSLLRNLRELRMRVARGWNPVMGHGTHLI